MHSCYTMPSPAAGAAVGGTTTVAGPVVAGTLASRLGVGRSAIASRCSFLVDFWGAGGVVACTFLHRCACQIDVRDGSA